MNLCWWLVSILVAGTAIVTGLIILIGNSLDRHGMSDFWFVVTSLALLAAVIVLPVGTTVIILDVFGVV